VPCIFPASSTLLALPRLVPFDILSRSFLLLFV
jgi:hypothetical protein